MKRKLLIVLAFTLLTSMLHATTVVATGMVLPESITQTTSGFIVTDVTGAIWSVPAGGGAASLLTTVPFNALGGMIMPASFDSLGGTFLVVGFITNKTGHGTGKGAASTIDLSVSPPTVTPYALQPRTAWVQPVLATDFGVYSGDILVTNEFFTVDFFTPTGGFGTLVTFHKAAMTGVEPSGAAFAPSGFGTVGGTLLVSDGAGSGAIYSIDSTGNINLFTTIPLSGEQTGLRQIAFAPQGFGSYGGDLFVSANNGAIYVVNGQGAVVGSISGTFAPRGLLFIGNTTLLFSDQSLGQILSAGPGDVQP